MAKRTKHHWLMKSEPETFSIEHLRSRKNGREPWDGIRNYQARNFMRDEMKLGDSVLFYHSNCKDPGVVGLARVASEAYPDPTAFDPESNYYDEKSDPDNPRWMLVDVEFVRKFPRAVTLTKMREIAELADMRILQRGNRLSITPVTIVEYETIVALAGG